MYINPTIVSDIRSRGVKMYINPTIGKIVGGCLMAVSLVFTVQLLTSFAVTGFDRIVYFSEQAFRFVKH